MGCGNDDNGPRLQKFGFQFCPQGFRLAAPHGTSTRGTLELDSRHTGPRLAAPGVEVQGAAS